MKSADVGHREDSAILRWLDLARLGRILLHRQHPVEEQQQTLAQNLRGHFGSFGITGNFEALKRFRELVVCAWRKWLGRRSQRARMTWDRMRQPLERNPLPRARILRPYSTA